uniref:CCHC-type domain-containing protein n=1 Tax=Anas platyrhynchos TaxID=8839 RepID=A0A8B9T359_ANAPL
MVGVTSALQAFALQIHPRGCFRCGRRGHVARDCSKKREPVIENSRVCCWVCGRSGHRRELSPDTSLL